MDDYTLTEIEVAPEDLLLDPRNPRIIEDPSDYICNKDTDYALSWVQEETLKAIGQGRFKVDKLRKSINESGFLNIDSIFVKKYNSNKYLVLEGNRRTAAIKSLVNASDVSDKARNSIQRIPVKVLEVEGGREEDVVTTFLAIRHLDGPLEWEPMQRAFVVFQTYLSILENRYAQHGFQYLAKAADDVSDLTKLTKANVKNSLSVVRIFQQLKDSDLGVTSSHFSIIEKTVSYPNLSQGYFEFCPQKLQFSNAGAEKFSSLCLVEDRPINDPKKVRQLHLYFKADYIELIDQIESRTITLEEADQHLEAVKESSRFLKTLRIVDKEIDKIRPVEYKGSAEETLLLKSIEDKINKKLAYIWRL